MFAHLCSGEASPQPPTSSGTLHSRMEADANRAGSSDTIPKVCSTTWGVFITISEIQPLLMKLCHNSICLGEKERKFAERKEKRGDFLYNLHVVCYLDPIQHNPYHTKSSWNTRQFPSFLEEFRAPWQEGTANAEDTRRFALTCNGCCDNHKIATGSPQNLRRGRGTASTHPSPLTSPVSQRQNHPENLSSSTDAPSEDQAQRAEGHQRDDTQNQVNEQVRWQIGMEWSAMNENCRRGS